MEQLIFYNSMSNLNNRNISHRLTSKRWIIISSLNHIPISGVAIGRLGGAMHRDLQGGPRTLINNPPTDL